MDNVLSLMVPNQTDCFSSESMTFAWHKLPMQSKKLMYSTTASLRSRLELRVGSGDPSIMYYIARISLLGASNQIAFQVNKWRLSDEKDVINSNGLIAR